MFSRCNKFLEWKWFSCRHYLFYRREFQLGTKGRTFSFYRFCFVVFYSRLCGRACQISKAGFVRWCNFWRKCSLEWPPFRYTLSTATGGVFLRCFWLRPWCQNNFLIVCSVVLLTLFARRLCHKGKQQCRRYWLPHYEFARKQIIFHAHFHFVLEFIMSDVSAWSVCGLIICGQFFLYMSDLSEVWRSEFVEGVVW